MEDKEQQPEGNKRPQDITSAERETRVLTVKQLIVQGYSRSDIVRYCAKNYNTKSRAVDDYLAEARAEIKKDFEKTFSPEDFKAEIASRMEDLYKKNYKNLEFRECRNILKDLAELTGVAAPIKAEITGKNGEPLPTANVIINMSFKNRAAPPPSE